MTTLLELKITARNKADILKNLAIGEDELTTYVNESLFLLYREIVQNFPNQYLQTFTFSLNNNEDGYTFPSSVKVFQVNGVDRQIDAGRWCDVENYNFQERFNYDGIFNTAYCCYNVAYNIRIGVQFSLDIIPHNNHQGNYRLTYTPDIDKLVNDEDELLPDFDKWSDFITTQAAIKCLTKLELPFDGLLLHLNMLKDEIKKSSSRRDALKPHKIARTKFRQRRFF